MPWYPSGVLPVRVRYGAGVLLLAAYSRSIRVGVYLCFVSVTDPRISADHFGYACCDLFSVSGAAPSPCQPTVFSGFVIRFDLSWPSAWFPSWVCTMWPCLACTLSSTDCTVSFPSGWGPSGTRVLTSLGLCPYLVVLCFYLQYFDTVVGRVL